MQILMRDDNETEYIRLHEQIEYDEFANLESSLNKKIHTTFQSFCFDRLAGTTSNG
jgi:hypothetical protein